MFGEFVTGAQRDQRCSQTRLVQDCRCCSTAIVALGGRCEQLRSERVQIGRLTQLTLFGRHPASLSPRLRKFVGRGRDSRASASVVFRYTIVSASLRLVLTYEVDQWTALGDPTRRAIFDQLAARPQAVGELARQLPISRPAVSQHLKVLKVAGLVTDRAVGTRRVYRLDPNGLRALRIDLERYWTQALATYKQIVEQSIEEN
jgi:DNA-binding transcriptional ArsR family regulator